jgi:biopolymer transport protein ExbD
LSFLEPQGDDLVLIESETTDAPMAIELTPIIDMVFLLLIFFLVASSFNQIEREMKIALPFAGSSGPISAALKEIIINVDADGDVRVAGRNMQLSELNELVANAVKTNSDQKVSVRGDRDTAYAHIVSVLDVCKHAGVQEPFLDTVLDQ